MNSKLHSSLLQAFLVSCILLYACQNSKPNKDKKTVALAETKTCKLEEWMNLQVEAYKQDIEHRLNSRFKAKNAIAPVFAPIGTEMGDRFVNNYQTTSQQVLGPEYTYAVSLNAKEIAYLANYLFLHKEDASFNRGIQFSFAKCDTCPNERNKVKRLTLVVGVAPGSKVVGSTAHQKMRAFEEIFLNEISGKKEPVPFYDDWHELWP
ncbi:MAG: hypothetical protein ABW007_14805 [Chitinophagaceae bacterium]